MFKLQCALSQDPSRLSELKVAAEDFLMFMFAVAAGEPFHLEEFARDVAAFARQATLGHLDPAKPSAPPDIAAFLAAARIRVLPSWFETGRGTGDARRLEYGRAVVEEARKTVGAAGVQRLEAAVWWAVFEQMSATNAELKRWGFEIKDGAIRRTSGDPSAARPAPCSSSAESPTGLSFGLDPSFRGRPDCGDALRSLFEARKSSAAPIVLPDGPRPDA